MSREIDQRIVDMQFNNRQFESGVKESTSSLEKLKKGLDFQGAGKGLSGLSDAASRFSLAGISQGVDTIAGKFSTLEIMGVTALANITNAAVNTGKQIVSALTIDPIKTGFSEFELKMGSIQTIMAGTGEELSTVNKYLDELNTYSDRTIYSFADMTENIGKFTNNGVSLKDSVSAIQGIANVAAISGANANEASRAMYNFSQALSSGYVQLIDWKSIELANMGTMAFKEQLIETAVAAGKLAKGADGMYRAITEGGGMAEVGFDAMKGFRDNLDGKWLTSDVLVKTLAKYTDETTDLGKKAFAAAQDVKTLSQMYQTLKEAAQSGWAQSWEIIIGDFNEGKSLWTELNGIIGGVIGSSADARRAMLTVWDELGGREALIQAFRNAFDALGEAIKPIKEAFRTFFPPMTGERLAEISKSILAFTEKLKMGEATYDKVKRIFKGLFAVVDIGRQFFAALAKTLFEKLGPAGEGLLGFAAKIGDWLVALRDAITNGDVFSTVIGGIATAIEKVVGFIGGVIKGLKDGAEGVASFFASFTGLNTMSFDEFMEKLKEKMNPLEKLGEFFKTVFGKIQAVFEKFLPSISGIFKRLFAWFSTFKEKLGEAFNQAGFKSITDLFNGGLMSLLIIAIVKFVKSLSKISDSASGVFKSFGGMFDGVKGIFRGITGVLDGVKGALVAYQNDLKAGTLLKIAISIAILVASLWILSTIDPDKLTNAILAITTLFAELTASMKLLTKSFGTSPKGQFGGMTGMAIGMISMAIAVLILAVALEKLSKLDTDALTKGVIALGAVIGELVAAAKVLGSGSKQMMSGTVGMVIFAAAILVLSNAVSKLGQLDTAELTKGLVGVGVLIGEMTLFTKMAKLDKSGFGTGMGLMLLALSVNMFARAVGIFANMSVKELIKGFVAITVILAELTAFTKLNGSATNMVSLGFGIMAIGVAMMILAQAIKIIGGLDTDSLFKALYTLGMALLAITIAIKVLPPDSAGRAAGVLVMAVAIAILANALKVMGSMGWEEMARGLVALAGSLLIMVVAMKFMQGSIAGAAAMIIMAIAITIMAKAMKKLGGMSWEEIGKSLLMLAGVFAILGVAALLLGPMVPVILSLTGSLALLGVAVFAIGAGILMLSTGLAALAVSGAAGAAALASIGMTLIALIPTLLTHFAVGLIAFAAVLAEGAPVIGEAVLKLLIMVCDVIIQVTPKLVEALMVLIEQLLIAIVEAVPLLVDAGMQIIIGLLQGIADNIAPIVQAGVDIVINFLDGIASKLQDIIDCGFNLIISFLDGLANSIRDNHQKLYDSIENLINAIIEAVVDFIPTLVGIGEDIIGGIIKGITNMATNVWEAAKGLVSDLIANVKDFLGIESPSKEFAEIGQYVDRGFIVGIQSMSKNVSESAKNVGKNAMTAMRRAVETAADLVSGDMTMSPTIRPVLDLATATAGVGRLNSMFSQNQQVAVSTISRDFQNGSPFQRSLDNLASSFEQTADQTVDLNGTVTVQVVNDKGEIIGIAQTAVKDLLRKESR